jgi:plasmid stabilization system protein ParE
MAVTYHPSVQRDVNRIVSYYDGISRRLGDEFWDELASRIEAATQNPERFHFASFGLRRVNLNRFPYHFLFRALPGKIRITVVRHNRRHPGHGLARR